MSKILSAIKSDLKGVRDDLLNWYFTKKALPYWAVLLLDCFICFVSGIFVLLLFTSASSLIKHFGAATLTISIYMIFNLIGFKVFHTYAGVVRYSSFVDLRRVAYAMILSCVIAEIMHYPIAWLRVGIQEIHGSTLFVALKGRQILAMYLLAMILMWVWRVLVKTIFDVSYQREKALRTLIFGVGDGGVGLAKNIRNQKDANFALCGFVTTDRYYRGKMLMGENIYYIDDKFGEVLESKGIQALLVSPLQTEFFRKNAALQDLFINADVKIFMVEGTKEWNKDSDYSTVQMKQISVEDLLPRDEIQVDMKKVGEMLTGKKILITGSAGSIGSEIVRQISEYKPSELMLIDSAETPQHDIRLMMARKWPEIKTHTIVGSISNASRMEHLFSIFQPDYVFHAAAYKHVPMMEDNPSESIQNNVYGTQVIADLSVKYGVKKFVMLSTPPM